MDNFISSLSPKKRISLFSAAQNLKYMRSSPFSPSTHALTHTGKYACGGARETSADLMIQPLQKG